MLSLFYRTAFALCFCFTAGLSTAYAGTHVHFAAFFNDGKNANFTFPATVVGDDIEGPLASQGAEMMLFAHSVFIHDGDVLNLQNDTLREVDGTFKDFGLNCQVTMHTNGDWKVSGMCETFITGNAKNKQIIMPTPLPKQLIWYKVFEDTEQGLAGYMMKEEGKDFSK